MKNIFFPKIVRRKDYDKKSSGEYYVYSHYKEAVSDDCKNRCVYCDIVIKEAGFEGFALDHFRPQEHFPELTNTPTNLVVACGKCNRLKWSHWPVGTGSLSTHNDLVGFIDPFDCDRHDFFKIESNGEIIPLKPPSSYLIKLLNLNRASRLLVRRNRMLEKRIDELISRAESIIDGVCDSAKKGESIDFEKIQLVQAAIKDIRLIRDSLGEI